MDKTQWITKEIDVHEIVINHDNTMRMNERMIDMKRTTQHQNSEWMKLRITNLGKKAHIRWPKRDKSAECVTKER